MFTELHARSAFSFLEGASLPEELAGLCAALGMPAMALTDRDGVYGAPRFHLAAKKAGVTAHIGSEITIVSNHNHFSCHPERNEGPAVSPRRHGGTEKPNSYSGINNQKDSSVPPRLRCANLPLLATSRLGYQNLCRLVTRMKMRGPKHAAPGQCAAREDDLRQFASGLLCLTGGDDGPLHLALEHGGPSAARRALEQLLDIFGRGNLYVELQRHFDRRQEARNQAAIELARSLGLPLVATNGVQYAQPAAREVLDVFTCIREHRRLETAGRLLARNSERHLKSADEMARLFADLPEAIAATQEISSRLQFTLADLGYEFPRYPVPEGETMMSFLRRRTDEGARERYLKPAKRHLWTRARRQIERELALIEKLDLAGYFLIVWDIVRFCRQRGILVQGRGSAANSAVCYSLGITAVDPIGMDLLFERFLSEERGEWPDIDLDLPSGDQRERAIQYVYERYGKLGAAMTANVITYRGRSAAREVGKALAFDAETLDRVSARMGTWEYKSPEDTLERHFRDAGLDLRHPRLQKFLELCLRLQDLPRHLGQHSGGMVICQGQLDSVVPLEPASMPGRVVVQWDKDDCADMGIIKVDLLGLGMMAVLEESLALIRRHHVEEVDLAHLPPDDPAVYDALCRADTVGMFQIESRAQMSCLPRLRPRNFYDIVVQIAIIRPGPIIGNMVHPYLKRRQGREAVVYPHPSLEPVLARTLGVPLFQEQLLRMAMIAAGFSGGEAEELRRAFGFKRAEARMADVEQKLRQGMARNGISGEAQEQIVRSITSFALYGFPESHSASFALLAYASAWLKCHYLAAFTAAMLNNQPMGFYHPATLVKDAQRHGLKFLPIDVNRSDWPCTLEPFNPPRRHGGTEETKSEVSSFEFQVSRKTSPRRHGDTEEANSNKNSKDSSAPSAFGSDDEPAFAADYQGSLGEIAHSSQLINKKSEVPFSVPPCLRGEIRDSSVSPCLRGEKEFAVRLGLRYVRGLREDAARALVRARDDAGPFASIHDLARRVPALRKDELTTLAEIGALNSVSRASNSVLGTRYSVLPFHRRDALWQVARAGRPAGPLLDPIREADAASPLAMMDTRERLEADFRGTGLTLGPHPLAHRRKQLDAMRVCRAIDLGKIPNGRSVRVAGAVIARQRPGTASGFVFLSLEDETGIANAIVTPDLFEQNRFLLVSEKFLLVEGKLQRLDNVISVKADRVLPLPLLDAGPPSHDFR